MKNSEKFLESFSRIEQKLRKDLQGDASSRFYDMVRDMSRKNRVVNEYREDLRQLGDLRNAIVHERADGMVIAEPNEACVELILKIENALYNPPKLLPAFKKDVFQMDVEESVGKALNLMYEYSFSQLPLYKNSVFIGLLTTDTVSRWLGASSHEDVFSLNDTAISKVITFAERKENYCFLKKDENVFSALAKFQEYENSGKILDSILITNTGKPNEKLMGIVTISDIPKMLRMVK